MKTVVNKLQILESLNSAIIQAEVFKRFDITRRLEAYKQNISMYMTNTDQMLLSDVIYLVTKEASLVEQLARMPLSQAQSEHEGDTDPLQKSGG